MVIGFVVFMQKNEGSKKEITVLDPKRSNAINIGLTVLPPSSTIKTAIMKMDNSIMNREGIEVSGKLYLFMCMSVCVYKVESPLTDYVGLYILIIIIWMCHS